MTDADPDAGSDAPLRLEVVAEPVAAELGPDLRSAMLAHSVVRAQYPNADLWVVSVDSLEKAEVAQPRFRAILADMAGSEVLEVEGDLWDLDSLLVMPTARPRLPNEEEHAWAVDVLRTDPELATRMDSGEVVVYRPMPPLANLQDADGSVVRAVTVGLRETGLDGNGVRHRVVAVRSSDGEILEHAPGLPQPAERECGAAPGEPCPPTAGEPQARVRVWQGDDLLWDFVVVRPSASSGVNGSGVELRLVDYQGVRVLHRAHVPILNVAYDGLDGGCGPTYRDWLNQESCFEADGDEPVAGFRVCAAAARTILERGEGGGGFRGVALWLEGDELVVASQLEAGWYRYLSEWRLHRDGTIRPRMGFAAVRNPCTCEPHTHHAYWRLDFDITGAGLNLVQEHNSPTLPGQLAPWHTIRYEVQRPRDPAHQRRWRVRTVRSAHGYAVVPGPDDGTADAFGAGDVWVLAYHPEELDDGEGFTTDPTRSRAHLDWFVTGELVEREDVVLWYGAHFRHAPGEGADDAPHRVGPDLEPFNWKPQSERGPYIPLAPPPQEGPDDGPDDPLAGE